MNKKFISIVAAFLFSVILWGSVSLSGDYFVTISVPIRITDIPDKYMADGTSEREVFLRLKGEGWKLSSISMGSGLVFKVSADYDSGRIFLNLNKAISENDWLTSGIQVYDISPDTISTRIARVFQKTVKIFPVYELQFEPGYGLAAPVRFSPDSVTVYGTRRRLRDLDSIPTVKKIFSNLERKTAGTIDLAGLDGLNYAVKNCTVTFDIQKIVDKRFDRINIEIQNVPKERDLILFPTNIDVVLRGGINMLGTMNSDAIRAFVDYNMVLADTTGSILPQLRIPDYTTVVKMTPDRIKYIIKKY